MIVGGRSPEFLVIVLVLGLLAAGALIATEAGAIVSSLDGGPVRAGSVVAAGPDLIASLRELLVSLGAHNVS
jgi:myo-inositol-1(or 4)-monophosphatase